MPSDALVRHGGRCAVLCVRENADRFLARIPRWLGLLVLSAPSFPLFSRSFPVVFSSSDVRPQVWEVAFVARSSCY